MKYPFKVDKLHLLNDNHYHKINTDKRQIVIGNTFSDGLNHVIRWNTRLNGKYTSTSSFTILKDGSIYLHFDPNYYSDFIGVKEIDMNLISIVLENQGWLMKDLINNKYLTWFGDIYNSDEPVFELKWRNHTYWSAYTDAQIESLSILCKYLCESFNIPLKVLSHNTNINMVEAYNGIIFKSNYSKYFSDVSPSFKFDEFKNKIEINN